MVRSVGGRVPVMVALALLGMGELLGCSSDSGTQPPTPDGQGLRDLGAHADGLPRDGAEPACGAGIYPCGPYGTTAGAVIADHSFKGFRDPKDMCLADDKKTVDTSQAVTLSLKMYHRWDPSCLAQRKKLLWLFGTAYWCGVCLKDAKNLQASYQGNLLDSRVALLNVLVDGETVGSAPTETQAKGWQSGVKASYPVVYDAKKEMTKYFTASNFPLNILIDLTTMKIYYAKNGDTLATIESKIQEFFK